MSKIFDALDELAKQTYAPEWKDPAIRQFVRTGDEALLPGIRPFKNSWSGSLPQELPAPDAWTDEASRVLRLGHLKRVPSMLESWLQRFGRNYRDNWPQFDAAIKILRAVGLSDAEIRQTLLACDLWESKEQTPTQAGELFLQLDPTDAEIRQGFQQSYDGEWQLPALLAHSQPERMEKLLAGGLKFKNASLTYGLMVRANPARFATKAFEVFEKLPESIHRMNLITTLAEVLPSQYLDRACAEARNCLRRVPIADDVLGRNCSEFMLQQNQPDALELCCQWMSGYAGENPWNAPHQRELIFTWAAQHQPTMIRPMAEACARCGAANVVLLGLKQWKQQGIAPNTSERFHEAIQRVLQQTDTAHIISAVAEARDWDLQRTSEDLWPLLQHKSRPVRGAAARVLAGLGFAAAGERAIKLLGHKKADVRQAAVMLLSQINDTQAIQALKHHLDAEENDDVRDNVLLVLESSGAGATLSPAEQQERIAKTLAKSKAAPAAWIHAEALVFKKRDDGRLTPEQTLYLLIRQSRCKEMRADLEAKPLYATLDRQGSGEASLALLQAFLGSAQDASDRWVLALAALTGDDRLVPVFRKAILDWAEKSRGKLAEYGAQALALLGTEAALMVVDSLSVRFRSKNKNIGQAAAEAFAAAAEAREVTVEELGDLVVPWLGFEPGKPRFIDAGKSQVEARIDAELKLSFRDVKTGKVMSKFPSGVSAEIHSEFKTLAGTLKEAVKAQLLRIETLLVRQFRWPTQRWRELYLAHPLLRPFTQRLVWGWRDADGQLRHTFRALEDSSLTDVEDHTVALPKDGSVSLVHPLDLSDEARAAWLRHLADYEIVPPFSQLDRPVVRATPENAVLKFGRQVHGTDVNAMTFRSRAEKLGWSRGSVCDGGGVTAYRKVFTGAGVEAFLSVEGLYVGISMDETIQLGDLYFVEAGSVKVGSYTYDEPGKDDDPRLIAFGAVPAVPFSEVMGDLEKIAGQSSNPEPETN